MGRVVAKRRLLSLQLWLYSGKRQALWRFSRSRYPTNQTRAQSQMCTFYSSFPDSMAMFHHLINNIESTVLLRFRKLFFSQMTTESTARKKRGEMNPILSNSDQGAATLKLDSWGLRNSEVVMVPSPSPTGSSYFKYYL